MGPTLLWQSNPLHFVVLAVQWFHLLFNEFIIKCELHLTGHLTDEDWVTVKTLSVSSDQGSSYQFFTFPEGFSAHWVRTVVKKLDSKIKETCMVTAYFHYT